MLTVKIYCHIMLWHACTLKNDLMHGNQLISHSCKETLQVSLITRTFINCSDECWKLNVGTFVHFCKGNTNAHGHMSKFLP